MCNTLPGADVYTPAQAQSLVRATALSPRLNPRAVHRRLPSPSLLCPDPFVCAAANEEICLLVQVETVEAL